MDDVLLERINKATPDFNATVVNGLAVEHMMGINPESGVNNTMAYVDRLISINQELFPEGLEYEGSQVCSPIRHFEELTREYNSKRVGNIARYDTYLVKYQFKYKGEPLMPRFIQLPLVRDGGLMTLNGATYNIAPVLTDVGFSVLHGGIFIPFRRTRLNFKRTDHHFLANGRRCIVYVIWSMIHNEMSNRVTRDLDNRRYINTSLAQYFFCRFGVTETFKRWAKADVQLGWSSDFPVSEYPQKDWVRFESMHLKGRHPTGELCLMIPVEQDTDFVRMLVGGFFYVADSFPNRFSEPSYADDVNQWRVILGHMVFGDFEHTGKVLENIDTHMRSQEVSLDEMTREELRQRGVYVNDIWDLFYTLMTDLSHHFYQTNTEETSMYNKKLMVLRYVTEEFNSAISLFAYGFQSRHDKEWSMDELNESLKRLFKLNTCTKRLTVDHGEVNTVSYPGDNKIFRVTSMLVPQDKARRGRGFGKGLISDSSRLLHSSIAEVGQYNNQPKTNPDGRARINPNVRVDLDGMVMRNPNHRELIDKTQKRYNR